MDKKEKQVSGNPPTSARNVFDERTISLCDLQDLTKNNEGKLLTMLEAIFPDHPKSKQLEAIKSLVRSILWDSNYTVRKWVYDNKDGKDCSTFPFPIATNSG